MIPRNGNQRINCILCTLIYQDEDAFNFLDNTITPLKLSWKMHFIFLLTFYDLHLYGVSSIHLISCQHIPFWGQIFHFPKFFHFIFSKKTISFILLSKLSFTYDSCPISGIFLRHIFFNQIFKDIFYNGSVVKTKIWDFYNELIWWISYKEHGENSGSLPRSNIC